jgi:hypothetical protein
MNISIFTNFNLNKVMAFMVMGISMALAQTKAPPYRIHCGGGVLFDTAGHYWEAD